MGEQLPYDKADRQSIYHYAIDLRGSTLREKTGAEEIADIRKNKGSFGNAVETHYFMRRGTGRCPLPRVWAEGA